MTVRWLTFLCSCTVWTTGSASTMQTRPTPPSRSQIRVERCCPCQQHEGQLHSSAQRLLLSCRRQGLQRDDRMHHMQQQLVQRNMSSCSTRPCSLSQEPLERLVQV